LGELGRADRGEILGMAEQDGPGIADPFMEADGAFGAVLHEIGGGLTKLQCHFCSPSAGYGSDETREHRPGLAAGTCPASPGASARPFRPAIQDGGTGMPDSDPENASPPMF